MLKQLVFIVYILLLIPGFAEEKTVNPGKNFQFQSIFEIKDQNENIIPVFSDFFSRGVSEAFFQIALTDIKNISLLSSYTRNAGLFLGFISLGSAFSFLTVVCVPVSVICFTVLSNVIAGVFMAILGGAFLIALIPFFVLAAKYYRLGKSDLEGIVNNINAPADPGDKSVSLSVSIIFH